MKENGAKILLVEDNELGRKEIGTLILNDLGYQVSSPASLMQLREAFTFELFDGLLVDVELSKFEDIGDKLGGKRIDDGIDILDFYSSLHQISSGRLYSSHVILPGSELGKKIREQPILAKPLPRNMEQIIKLC